MTGLLKAKEWLDAQVNAGMGRPLPQDEGNIYQYAPLDIERQQAALNLAGLAETGSIPFAPKSAGGTLGTFIGPKAARWNKEASEKAVKLLDAGADPESVWKEHMIGRMPDGSLFSEIPDNQAFYRGSMGAKSGYANDVYLHPELYDNYPHIENMRVREHSGRGGSFDPHSWEFNIGTERDSSSVMAHETQHAIQAREGWQTGGSPEAIKSEYKKARARLNFLEKEPDYLQGANESDAIFNRQLNGEIDENQASFLLNELVKKYPSYAEVEKQIGILRKTSPDGFDAYRRLTGEAQARAVQDRLEMDMQQRREVYPLRGGLLSDVSIDRLINRKGSGVAMSLPETEFSKAHKIAQKNAALSIEKGGLGLPPDNTAMDRAKAMGFSERDMFHGTSSEFPAFSLFEGGGVSRSPVGKLGVSMADNPHLANEFADLAQGKSGDLIGNAGANVLPLLHRTERPASLPLPDDALNSEVFGAVVDAFKSGHDALRITNYTTPNGKNLGPAYLIKEPHNIRSKFAAFDPMQRNSANLLASGLLSSLILNDYMGSQNGRTP
ncbi:MAG: hypothetical protein WAW41_07905 [Methylobacter sp.]